MSTCEVSVIVCTYNPNMDKLKKTLDSLMNQKKVKFELIITDDGSADNKFHEIKKYFSSNNFLNFKLVSNAENQGTVKNILSGLKKAEGKYIYLISPGDYLYDESVLHDCLGYAEKNKSCALFGNAIWYKEDKIIDKNAPKYPKLFSKKILRGYSYIVFLGDNAILGPAYFRSKGFAEKYFNKINNICKYVEDNTSTSWALLEGVRIDYFNRKMLYYEYGSGISTNDNTEWNKQIALDYENNNHELKKAFPNSDILDYIYTESKLKKYIKHPILLLESIIYKIIRNFLK